MKFVLNIIWIGALIWILFFDMLLTIFSLNGNINWILVFLFNLILIPVYFLRNYTKKLSGDDYISVWFKVLKIRFLNWKNNSKQQMEEEIERNSPKE